MVNPVFNLKAKDYAKFKGKGCTVEGIATLTVFYLLFVVAAALISWRFFDVFRSVSVVFIVLAFLVGLYAVKHPLQITYLGPLYAVLEGFSIGLFSKLMESLYLGVVQQAAICTFGIAFSCGLIYCYGNFTFSNNFKKFVAIATAGVAFIYLIDAMAILVLGINIPFLHDCGPVGFLVSFIIIILVSLNLMLDYERIVNVCTVGVDEKFEPYFAFGLTLTLLWLYLELLRVLARSRSRR